MRFCSIAQPPFQVACSSNATLGLAEAPSRRGASFSTRRGNNWRIQCHAAPLTAPHVVIASRGSKLALQQTNQVIALIKAHHGPSCTTAVEVVETRGDVSKAPTMKALGQGAFTDDVDARVAAGHADLAVHSLKDAPAALPVGLVLAACLEREDVRDAFISVRGEKKLGDMPAGSRIGTSSTRRRAQILQHHPHLVVVPLRGNVDARLAKITAGEADATVLALSGLKRLGRGAVVSSILDESEMLLAACQGAIGITCREGDENTIRMLSSIGHFPTMMEVVCERAMLSAIMLDAQQLPSIAVACHAHLAFQQGEDTAQLLFQCLIADEGGQVVHPLKGEASLDPRDLCQAVQVGAAPQLLSDWLSTRSRLLERSKVLGSEYGAQLRGIAVSKGWM